MTTYDSSHPDQRRRWLDQHGIGPALGNRDEYARNHPNVAVPGFAPPISADEALVRHLLAGDPSRTIRTMSVDTQASGPETGLVYRHDVVNLDCPYCGGDAVRPPTRLTGGFYICNDCWTDRYNAQQAEDAEAGLQLRTANAFLDEVLPGYGEGPLGNPMTGGPRYRSGRIGQR